jgi:hypothetical protein
MDDVDLFLRVLLGTEINPTYQTRGDLNDDGTADGADIAAFTQAMLAT